MHEQLIPKQTPCAVLYIIFDLRKALTRVDSTLQ
jgi:hypothetical protein